MKAIVLSYDRNLIFVDHMIQTYQRIWPENPFVFKIPFNNTFPNDLKDKYGDKVEIVKTDPSIKKSVLTLLEDLDDEEWIYWCIDDKYLIDLLVNPVEEILKWIPLIRDPKIAGISFARARRLNKPENLFVNDIIYSSSGQPFIRRKFYYQIWLHQILKVKVLRLLFQGFPDEPFKAKMMDHFINGLPIDDDIKLYVSKKNHVVFGESTERGKVTKSIVASLKKYNLKLPEELEISNRSITIGQIPKIDKFRNWLKAFLNSI